MSLFGPRIQNERRLVSSVTMHVTKYFVPFIEISDTTGRNALRQSMRSFGVLLADVVDALALIKMSYKQTKGKLKNKLRNKGHRVALADQFYVFFLGAYQQQQAASKQTGRPHVGPDFCLGCTCNSTTRAGGGTLDRKCRAQRGMHK